MRTLLKITVAMVALAVISCEKPQVDPQQPGTEQPGTEQPTPEVPEPPELPQLEVNTYEVDGERNPFGSVAVSNFGEYVCIAATPAEGVENFDEVFEQEEYFYVAVSPLLVGREFDMMQEGKLFTVMSTLDGAYLESVAPSLREEIVSGTCLFDYKEGVAAVEAHIELADGTHLSVKLSAEEQGIVVNENTFAIAGDQKPVRTAFSLVEDGVTALYLTPAGISYFDDLPITTYYAYVILDSSKCHGRTLGVEDLIAAGYADNFNELIVDSRKVKTTGTVNVAADPDDPTHFVVAMDLDFDGTSLEVSFDGKTLDANAKEVIESKFKYEGKSYGITGVSLGYMPEKDDVYAVRVKTERNDEVVIGLPAKFLDDNAHGFSQSADLFIEYDGVVYSKANGSSGTVTIGVDGGMININVTNYDNLEIIYEGPYENAL